MCSARYEEARELVEIMIQNAEPADGFAPYNEVYSQIANEFQRLVLAEVVEQRHPHHKTVLVNGALYIVPKHFVKGEDY